MRESIVQIESFDLLEIFEGFFTESEQNPARFFDYDNGQFSMVMALPGVDLAWLKSLDRESTNQWIESADLKKLDEGEFKFFCGCCPKKMSQVIHKVYDGQFEELFGPDKEVEVMCPRCGHEWELTREDLDNEN